MQYPACGIQEKVLNEELRFYQVRVGPSQASCCLQFFSSAQRSTLIACCPRSLEGLIRLQLLHCNIITNLTGTSDMQFERSYLSLSTQIACSHQSSGPAVPQDDLMISWTKVKFNAWSKCTLQYLPSTCWHMISYKWAGWQPDHALLCGCNQACG